MDGQTLSKLILLQTNTTLNLPEINYSSSHSTTRLKISMSHSDTILNFSGQMLTILHHEQDHLSQTNRVVHFKTVANTVEVSFTNNHRTELKTTFTSRFKATGSS